MPYLHDRATLPSISSTILTPFSPTMLLTKPLTTFLQSNLTPQLHTLLLLTPAGKVLSSASPLPASVLRGQATIACSLWDLYAPLALDGAFSSALPRKADNSNDSDEDDEYPSESDPDLNSILIQLEHGTMVIRGLQCGLLFVAISHSPSFSTTTVPLLHQGLEHLTLSAASPPSHIGILTAESGNGNGDTERDRDRANLRVPQAQQDLSLNGSGHGQESGAGSATASDSGSTNTSSGGTSVRLIRKQAEELGKWLDTQLEGFELGGPL